MFELKIMQKGDSHYSTEDVFFYFKDADLMFDFLSIALTHTQKETEYAIRVIEEGQIEDDED